MLTALALLAAVRAEAWRMCPDPVLLICTRSRQQGRGGQPYAVRRHVCQPPCMHACVALVPGALGRTAPAVRMLLGPPQWTARRRVRGPAGEGEGPQRAARSAPPAPARRAGKSARPYPHSRAWCSPMEAMEPKLWTQASMPPPWVPHACVARCIRTCMHIGAHSRSTTCKHGGGTLRPGRSKPRRKDGWADGNASGGYVGAYLRVRACARANPHTCMPTGLPAACSRLRSSLPSASSFCVTTVVSWAAMVG